MTLQKTFNIPALTSLSRKWHTTQHQ